MTGSFWRCWRETRRLCMNIIYLRKEGTLVPSELSNKEGTGVPSSGNELTKVKGEADER